MFESSLTEYTTDELFELFMCTILTTISSSRISINVSLDNTFKWQWIVGTSCSSLCTIL